MSANRSSNNPTSEVLERKSLVDAYLLGVCLGTFGAHHFYMKRYFFGFAYLCTFGLGGVGYLVDLIRMRWLVRKANEELERNDSLSNKSLIDAYVLLIPFGLMGLHLFYLEKYKQGTVYLLTFGLFGFGVVLDLWRTQKLVAEANGDDIEDENEKYVETAYMYGLSPIGISGSLHYYLGRKEWALLYLFTFGLLGVGWLCDWIRTPFLVNRENQIQRRELDPSERHVDDAYILWFPLGFFGLHHFYLRRFKWGILYAVTLGLFGVGWIIDMFRMKSLVEDCNRLHASTRSRSAIHAINQIRTISVAPAEESIDPGSLDGVSAAPDILNIRAHTVPTFQRSIQLTSIETVHDPPPTYEHATRYYNNNC